MASTVAGKSILRFAAAGTAIHAESLDAMFVGSNRAAVLAALGDARLIGLGESRHDTREQLLFKNGLEATWWIGRGFYADGGVHFTNFAVDEAAVPWYVTPTFGIGWQAGRWMDLQLAYEADLDDNDYVAHSGVLKLDFLF